jgi:hypothetical protein
LCPEAKDILDHDASLAVAEVGAISVWLGNTGVAKVMSQNRPNPNPSELADVKYQINTIWTATLGNQGTLHLLYKPQCAIEWRNVSGTDRLVMLTILVETSIRPGLIYRSKDDLL